MLRFHWRPYLPPLPNCAFDWNDGDPLRPEVEDEYAFTESCRRGLSAVHSSPSQRPAGSQLRTKASSCGSSRALTR